MSHPKATSNNNLSIDAINRLPESVTLSVLEDQALSLPEDQRAILAAHLLDSPPAVLHDDDAGLTEAARRDAELDSDPSAGMTLEEFKASFGR